LSLTLSPSFLFLLYTGHHFCCFSQGEGQHGNVHTPSHTQIEVTYISERKSHTHTHTHTHKQMHTYRCMYVIKRWTHTGREINAQTLKRYKGQNEIERKRGKESVTKRERERES